MKPFSNTLQIMDLVSVYFNNPFFSHFAKLIGKRTSIYSKIISQFLPVKGDRKPAAALLHHLLGKIGKQSSPDGFRCRMKASSGKFQVLLRHNHQHVMNQFLVTGAGIRTGAKNLSHLQKRIWQSSAAVTPMSSFSPGIQAYVSPKT